MSKLTNLLHLIKPDPEEKYNVADFNMNADILDSAIKDLQNKNNSQDSLFATKKALESESTRAKESEGHILSALETEVTRATNAENTHNVSGNAHEDIRNLISDLTTRLNALMDSDDTTLDQLSEIIAYIKSNRSLIENVTTNKVNVSDIIDNLTSDFTNKPLSSKQGKILKGFIDVLDSALNTHTSDTNPHGITKSDVELGNVPNVTTNDQTPTFTEATSLTKLSNGEKLSVAFGKISKAITDLIAHIGNKSNPHGVTKSQVGLGNVENKSSATIRGELTKDNVTTALGYTPSNTNTAYGVATSSALGLIKSGTDITVDSGGNVSVNDDSHNHVISNVDGLQTALDSKASSSHTHSSYINQNAFSNIKVGSKTLSADAATDTIALVAGDNITLTPDMANNKITISSSGSGNGIIYSGSEPTNATENMTWID